MPTSKILIIDDDHDIADLISESFRFENYDTRVSTTINDARRKMSNENFDSIIVDFNFGPNTSTDFIMDTTAARKDKTKPYIFLISGDIDMEDLREIAPHLAGAMLKPFEMQELVNCVSKKLKESQL